MNRDYDEENANLNNRELNDLAYQKYKNQDEKLGELANVVSGLKYTGQDISNEADQHLEILDRVEENVSLYIYIYICNFYRLTRQHIN